MASACDIYGWNSFIAESYVHRKSGGGGGRGRGRCRPRIFASMCRVLPLETLRSRLYYCRCGPAYPTTTTTTQEEGSRQVSHPVLTTLEPDRGSDASLERADAGAVHKEGPAVRARARAPRVFPPPHHAQAEKITTHKDAMENKLRRTDVGQDGAVFGFPPWCRVIPKKITDNNTQTFLHKNGLRVLCLNPQGRTDGRGKGRCV